MTVSANTYETLKEMTTLSTHKQPRREMRRFPEIYNGLTGDKRIEVSYIKARLPSTQCSPGHPGWFK